MCLSRREADEEIDATENEEDWIEYIKWGTKEAEEYMEKHKITCWIETHRRQKWRNGTKNHYPARKKMEQKSIQLASWTGH